MISAALMPTTKRAWICSVQKSGSILFQMRRGLRIRHPASGVHRTSVRACGPIVGYIIPSFRLAFTSRMAQRWSPPFSWRARASIRMLKFETLLLKKVFCIPAGSQIGFDPEHDRKHHFVTEAGVVVDVRPAFARPAVRDALRQTEPTPRLSHSV